MRDELVRVAYVVSVIAMCAGVGFVLGRFA